MHTITKENAHRLYDALENSIDCVTQEVTNHKVMWGDEPIPTRAAQRANLVNKEREHKDCMELLQGLLAQSEGQPVVTVTSLTDGSCWCNYKLEWHKDVPEGTKLFTHPAPLVPITADMVTDEISFAYQIVMSATSDHDYKAVIAAAVNAWGAKQ